MINPSVMRELYLADEADRRRADIARARRALAVPVAHRRPASPRLLAILGRVVRGAGAADVVPTRRDDPCCAASG